MSDEKTVGQGHFRFTKLGSGSHLSEMVRGETVNAMLDVRSAL